VARRSEAKGGLLRAWLAEHQPERIGDAEFTAIATTLAPVSERYLRELVRAAGVPLEPLVEGVSQHSLEDLERTLVGLLDEYERGEQRRARSAVILAKDHARFALRRLPATDERVVVKQEMLLWLMTWLENPPLFRDWVVLRKRQMPV
jgi:hypothetical protein